MPPEKATAFLPTTRDEMLARGWDQLDVLLVTGDAYVDHPAFGAAVIGRVLEAEGLRVGILAQPDWTDPAAFAVMGAPRLFVGVTAGAMDSMVANFTANRKKRRDDAYAPGGRAGRRPNNASLVYTTVVRQVFKGVPVVLGGVEASLRRFAHYDYWKDGVRRSILLDSKADLVVAGMGEKQVVEIARRLDQGRDLRAVPGTVEWRPAAEPPEAEDVVELDTYESVAGSRKRFLENAVRLERAVVCRSVGEGAPPIVQRHGERLVVEWAPRAVHPEDLDRVSALPFQRRAHPSYRQPVPALEPVQFSVVSHRGCFGGCSFCALALHQGRRVVSRSEESILAEIRRFSQHPDFKGTVTDVGGPTANMYGMEGRDKALCARCARPSCLFPSICKNLKTAHDRLTGLMQSVLHAPGVKHCFIASGIRHDLVAPSDAAYLRLLAERLTGGHLSVAPEHVAERVLRRMRKPPFEVFERFLERFLAASAAADKKQYAIPYFIASFPGSTDADMDLVAEALRRLGRRPQQIQDFLPGPMTLAAAMYYVERDAETDEKIFVAKKPQQRARQRAKLLRPERARYAGKGPRKSSEATGEKPGPKGRGKPGATARGKPGATARGKPAAKGRFGAPAGAPKKTGEGPKGRPAGAKRKPPAKRSGERRK